MAVTPGFMNLQHPTDATGRMQLGDSAVVTGFMRINEIAEATGEAEGLMQIDFVATTAKQVVASA